MLLRLHIFCGRSVLVSFIGKPRMSVFGLVFEVDVEHGIGRVGPSAARHKNGFWRQTLLAGVARRAMR